MAMFITDPWTIEEIKARRAQTGADQHDEVWDGVYIVSPLANNEHQDLVSRLTGILFAALDEGRLGSTFAGVNVSDRADDWTVNYREPDVAVFLQGTTALNKGTYWLGGPDLVVEILSENDHGREKLAFYAKVGVRELLIVDRDPWRLELYRPRRRKLTMVGASTRKAGEPLASKVLPLTFRLLVRKPRPMIEVVHADGRRWEV
jgi:Uma2 family endonuclease